MKTLERFEASSRRVFIIWAVGMTLTLTVILVTSLIPRAVRETMRVDLTFLAGMAMGASYVLMIVPVLFKRTKAVTV